MVSTLNKNDNKYHFDPSAYQATSETINKTAEQFQKATSTVKESLHNLQKEAFLAFECLKSTLETSPIHPYVKKINRLSNDIERVLNLAGSIPGISKPSGLLRSTFGMAQTIAGISILIISEIGIYFSSQNLHEEILKSKWKSLSTIGLEYAIHGSLNTLKGSIETLVGSYFFGLGSLGFLIPSFLSDRDFDPYFTYGTLSKKVSD